MVEATYSGSVLSRLAIGSFGSVASGQEAAKMSYPLDKGAAARLTTSLPDQPSPQDRATRLTSARQ
ncbi:MAG: hypothetical protein ACRDTC_25410 [Pseudonocardiaceae bacterium]